MIEMGASEVLIDGEVLEADPPRRLVQTWRALWSPELAAERPTRLTWEIDEDSNGLTRVTVTHELEGAPVTAATVFSDAKVRQGGGGWSWVLSDLKSLLETGNSIA
jgi:uncharacterized protein YndB with AHSA1/START domain